MENKKPLVSIIIPARNASKYIEGCLESLEKLDYPEFEVIIVNDGSSDATKDILDRFEGIKVLETFGVGPSKARNLAIKEAKGEYVAFTDADCIVHPQWLNELLKGFIPDPLTLSPVVGVGGDQKSPEDDSSFGKTVHGFFKTVGFVAEYVKNKNNGIVMTKHNPTCNVIYKKTVLMEAGGFLEGLWPGEDLELDYRLAKKGYRFLYNPDAIVYHYRAGTINNFNKMMFNYGRAQAVLVRMYGPFRFIHFLPVFLLCFAALCLILKHLQVFVLIMVMGLLTITWLMIKAKDIKKTAQYLGMLFIAFVCWNAGFIKGMVTH